MDIKKQIYFWVGVFVVLVGVFTRYYQSFFEAFYFVSMLFPVVVGTCYFFNLFLVDKYLVTKRYFLFGLYSVYMLIVSLYLEMVVIVLAFIFLAEYSVSNLDPISTDIFVLAVTLYLIVFVYSFLYLIQKTQQNEWAIKELTEEKEKYEIGSFVVRSNRQNRQITFSDVLYVESLADYVKIHLIGNNTVQTKEKISALANRLPDHFIRIHRSFLINVNAISSFNKDAVTIQGQTLSISRTYKPQVLAKLNN